MESKNFDIIIIGAGPGGYLAAERAGMRGEKVLLIEKDDQLGGVCLNRGCIPTKALLNTAKILHKAQHSTTFGINVTDARYDLHRAMAWKKQVVATLTKGVDYQMKKHHVMVVHGHGQIKDRNAVLVDDVEYKCQHLIIATGSSPSKPSVPGIELNHVMTSDEILEIDKIPGKLVVIGGGVIGLEFASLFSMLGTKVTVIEMLPEILPNFDKDLAMQLRKAMDKCHFITNARVIKIDQKTVSYSKNDEQFNVETDVVLIATGRTPNLTGYGLENLNLDLSRTGIRVDEKMRTNIPNVYAIGDVNGKSLLAHSAYRMGEVAVNVICGDEDRMRYNAIPWIVYSDPEISCVGITADQAQKENRVVKTASLQLRANGRFLAEHGNDRGLCKVIVDAQTDALIGVSILGGNNSEIIYGAAAMIEAELRVKDIKDIIFPHPTISEIIKDTIWELN